MNEIAQRLRAIADELEAATPPVLVAGPNRLLPMPARMVRPGYVILPDLNSRLQVEAIETTDASSETAGPLLSLDGRMIRSPFGDDYGSSHLVYADEWVVVER